MQHILNVMETHQESFLFHGGSQREISCAKGGLHQAGIDSGSPSQPHIHGNIYNLTIFSHCWWVINWSHLHCWVVDAMFETNLPNGGSMVHGVDPSPVPPLQWWELKQIVTMNK
jgi:hypothetical protein